MLVTANGSSLSCESEELWTGKIYFFTTFLKFLADSTDETAYETKSEIDVSFQDLRDAYGAFVDAEDLSSTSTAYPVDFDLETAVDLNDSLLTGELYDPEETGLFYTFFDLFGFSQQHLFLLR